MTQSFGDPGTAQSDGDATRTATVNVRADTTQYSAAMADAQRQTSILAGGVDTLTTKISGLTHSAGRGLKIFAAADFTSLAGMTASAAAFQHELSTLSATAAVTGRSFNGMKSAVETATAKFPVTQGQVAQLTTAISNMGVTGARDLGSLTQTFIKLGAATGESSTGLGSGLIQLSRQMGNTSSTSIGNFANSLLTVSKNAGVSASGVLEFGQAIAPMARQAGIGEAAVLGISTAFNKAGADGYVAANTFNTLINNVTQLARTGSPELVKYASFVGKTVDQFKKLPAKEQISELFKGIAAGGPNALNFVNELGLGIRSQSAVAAVAQQGGIDKYINQAEGASHNQKNLDKGAAAAFNNVSDGVTRLRNQLQLLADTIGGPLLQPLGMLIGAIAKGFGDLNTVIRTLHLQPLIEGLMLLAGGLATIGGVILAHGLIGKIGMIAAGRMAATSGPMGALREGVATGRAGEGAPLGPYGTVVTGERGAPARVRYPYRFGARLGGMFPTGPAPEEGEPGVGPSTGRQVFVGMGRGVPRAATGYFNMATKVATDSTAGHPLDRSAYDSAMGRGPDIGMKARLAALIAENKAEAASAGVIGATTKASKEAAEAYVKLAAATVRAGGSAGAASARFVMGRSGPSMPLPGAAGGEAAAAGGLRAMASGVSGALFSPAGMAAMMFGPSLIGKLQDAFKGPAKPNLGLDNYVNPVAHLNDALGIATKNLASFSTGLENATDKLPTSPSQQTDLSRAATVTPADMARFQNKKVTDKNVQALTTTPQTGGTNRTVANAVAIGRSYDMSDPRTVAAYKDQLISAGYTKAQVDSVLGQIVRGGAYLGPATADYGALGGAVRGNLKLRTKDHGQALDTSLTPQVKALLGTAATGIESSFEANLTTHSADYARGVKLQQLAQFLQGGSKGKAALGGGIEAAPAVAALLGKLTGADPSKYLEGDFLKGGGGTNSLDTAISLLQQTPQGKALLKGVGGKGQITPAKLAQFIKDNAASPPSNPSALSGTPIGSAIQGSQIFQDVTIGQHIGDPAAQQRAAESLVSIVGSRLNKIYGPRFGGGTRGSTDYAAVSGNLMQMSDLVGADSQQGQVLGAAAQQARLQQSFAMPFMSRAQRYRQINENYQQSSQAMQGPNPSDATVQQYQADVTAKQQMLQEQASFAQQMYQRVQQYNTQMVRAAQDEAHNEFLTRRNLNIQLSQMEEDFQRSQTRARDDFNRSLTRQAEDEAKAIYNPFLRVQAQYTASAGATLQNLLDQNKFIARQSGDLNKLKKMGLSQRSIDTMQLADPNNAQQTDRLAQDVVNDPKLINQINKAVGVRGTATTALTQSSFNQTYRRTLQDFQIGQSRAEQDYNTARERAVKAEQLALGDMAFAYNQMVQRSGQDLKTEMKELYGGFGDIFKGALSQQLEQLHHFAPKAADIIQTQLDALRSANKLAPNGALGKPNTLGINAKGQTGYYDAEGKFHDKKVSANVARGLPAIVNPLTGHAMGVISTKEHVATVSEGNRPEMILPLDMRGQQFLAGMYNAISRQMLMQMHTSPYPTMPRGAAGGSTVITEDHSLNFTGDITVEAQDPNEMARKLEARRRLQQLSRPRRHS